MQISLQISLTPADIPHAALILPHQLRIWAPQAAEVLLVWDLDPGPRYESEPGYRAHWQNCLSSLELLNSALRQDFPGIRILTSASDDHTRQHLSERFFRPGSPALPAKDCRGGPFSAYFAALALAAHPLILHLDADMMFGGQSPHWLSEARTALTADPGLLCISPPGGPPPWTTEQTFTPWFSSRCFLLDRRQLAQALELSYRDPAGTPGMFAPYAELPENLISRFMQQQQLQRHNLAGSEPGMWSLHPPVPPQPDFLPLLPRLLAALDQQRLPALQQGDYNLRPATLQALAREC